MDLQQRIRELEMENRQLRKRLGDDHTPQESTATIPQMHLSVQSIPDAVIVTSYQEGLIIDVNESFCQKFGYEKEEIIQKTVHEIKLWYHPSQRKEMVNQLNADKKISNFEALLKSKDEKLKNVLISAYSFKWKEKEYLFALLRDITEWKEMKQVLKQSEKNYSRVFNSVPIGLYKASSKGVILEANDAMVQILGYPDNKTLCGTDIQQHYLFSGESLKNMQSLKENGKLLREVQLKKFDGSTIWVVESSKLNYSEDNKIESISGYIRDISEKIESREQLEREQQKFKILSEYIKSAVFTFDEDGYFNYSNRSMEAITGYSSAELQKIRFWELVHPEHREVVLKRGMGRLQGKKITSSYEFKILTRQGKVRWVEISNSRIILNNKPVVLGSAIDVTEKKQAIEKLLESERRLLQISGNLKDVIWISDYKTDELIFVSPSFKKIWELNEVKEGEHLRSWLKSVHRDDLKVILNKVKEGKMDGSYEAEYRIITPQGKLKWLHQKAAVIKDENGFPHRITGVTRDITEEKYSQLLQTTIYKITSGIINNADLNIIFESIKLELSRMMDAKNIFIILYNQEKGTFSLPFFVDEKDQFNEFPAGKTLSAYVINKGEPCLFREKEMKQLEEADEIERVGSDSKVWLGAPMISNGNVIGLIGLQHYYDENALNERDLKMLHVIASQLAILLERKKIEINLKESEEKFRHLAENIPGIVYLCRNDKDYSMLYLNDMIENYTGHNKELYLKGDCSFAEMIHPEDAVKVRKEVDKSLDKKASFAVEYRLQHKDGTYRWMKEVGIGIWRNEELQHLEGFIIDVSEQKNAELKLRNELSTNQAMVSVSSELLSTKLSFRKISTLILNYARTLTGSRHGLIGSYEDDISVFKIHNSTFFKDEVSYFEIDRRNPKVQLKWLDSILDDKIYLNNDISISSGQIEKPFKKINIKRVMSLPSFFNKQAKGHIVLINPERDFEEDDLENIKSLMDLFAVAINRSQIENQMLLAKEKAEESDRLKTAFLANMSHEIRTPLNGVLGFAELLSFTRSEEEIQEYIKIINDSGLQLLNIINDIIDLSKIEAGELEIRYDTVDLNDLCLNLYAVFQKKIEKTGKLIKLEFIAPDEVLLTSSDPKRLQQILGNLIDNAIKFTKSGSITYGYYKTGEGLIRFFVRDTGVGIPVSKQKVIFERFRQIDDSFTREFGGTGLGLAICKNIVEMMNGRIWVESNNERGSNFYFELPLVKVEKEFDGEEDILELSDGMFKSWEDKSILIVEDDEANYKYLKAVLDKTHISTHWAKNGKEAIHVFDNSPKFDVVLMDIQLPVLNGLETTREIKKRYPQLPVIAQTAFVMTDDVEKCFSAGCDGYLAKPVKINHLFEELSKHI